MQSPSQLQQNSSQILKDNSYLHIKKHRIAETILNSNNDNNNDDK